MLRVPAALAALLALSACAEPVWAPDEAVARARYVHDGPTTITLYTGRNVRDGGGAHSALLVSGSQRVMFDPAGSFSHESFVERNDVIFGMTDRMLGYYVDFYTRPNLDMTAQTIVVPPAVAEEALRLVQEHGAVPKARCAQSVSGILRELEGFEGIGRSYFPLRVQRDFAVLPGVETRHYRPDPAEGVEAVRDVRIP